MAELKLDREANAWAEMREGEKPHHVHHTPSEKHVLTLFESQEDDPDYDGEPYRCPLCGKEVDYGEGDGGSYEGKDESYYDISYNEDTDEYECGECGYSHEMEHVVKGHYTREHGE